jgi:hypothetical protein
MKSIIIIISCLCFGFSEQEYENFGRRYSYIDLPVLGNGFALLFPSRVLSFSVDLSKYSGFYIEPLYGYNMIYGFGMNLGIYGIMRDKHIGIKFALLSADDVGAGEIYFDFQNYSRFTRSFSLRYGFSIGYGVNKIGQENQDGKTSTNIEEGPTARVNFDLSWRTVLLPNSLKTNKKLDAPQESSNPQKIGTLPEEQVQHDSTASKNNVVDEKSIEAEKIEKQAPTREEMDDSEK